ncbi:homoserine kinase [Methanofervidicoccus sp. A16]|uniref:homoserine kinase n=1 Tax=Methanofervidicoccus sp. A16 TaxID=2607662 RepID=UPI00118B3856|nr:homoserine kinase [Methanofervidicoccus sp. A16]AXI25264.1 homoserine kinase [Methanofervidicoccus sp. A16]
MERIKVTSPATSANLGPGYDIFGLALSEPYDTITLSRSKEGISISLKGKGAEKIPTDVDRNTAGVVAREMIKDFNIEEGVKIEIEKGIRPGSGLGSSAASSAGVAFAMNELFNLNLSKLELVKYASLGESISAGFPHADNVAPAIYGGFTMVINYDPLEVLHIPVDFEVVVALPDIEVSTKKAREILPDSVPLRSMVNNVGKACGMIYSLFKDDVELFGRCMMGDKIVEPYRSQLIPGYSEVKEEVRDLVYGITISGSGPGVIIVPKEGEVSKIKEILNEVWGCPVYHTKVGSGVQILERD